MGSPFEFLPPYAPEWHLTIWPLVYSSISKTDSSDQIRLLSGFSMRYIIVAVIMLLPATFHGFDHRRSFLISDPFKYLRTVVIVHVFLHDQPWSTMKALKKNKWAQGLSNFEAPVLTLHRRKISASVIVIVQWHSCLSKHCRQRSPECRPCSWNSDVCSPELHIGISFHLQGMSSLANLANQVLSVAIIQPWSSPQSYRSS